MATLKEIADDLYLKIRRRPENDEEISTAQIKFNVKHWRAKLIRQSFQKNKELEHQVIQDLGCVQLEKIDLAECCGISTGCEATRTVERLPQTIRLNIHTGYTFVGKVDKATKIPLISPFEVELFEYRKYGKQQPAAFIIDGYMYFINLGEQEIVNIRGVFEDPEDVKRFKTCDGDLCYDESTPFPIAIDMLDTISNGILKGTLIPLVRAEADMENDRV